MATAKSSPISLSALKPPTPSLRIPLPIPPALCWPLSTTISPPLGTRTSHMLSRRLHARRLPRLNIPLFAPATIVHEPIKIGYVRSRSLVARISLLHLRYHCHPRPLLFLLPLTTTARTMMTMMTTTKKRRRPCSRDHT